MTDTPRPAALDLSEADELLHALPAGAGPSFRESYYFGFYDPVADIGGFESFGYRTLKEHSGSMVTLWRPGDVSAALDLGGALTEPGRYRVGDFEAVCREPFHRWDLSHRGVLCRVRNAGMRQPVENMRDLPSAEDVDVVLDAQFESDLPIAPYERRQSYEHIFSECYEQIGRIRGTLVLGDEKLELDCPAVRHHAWGTRDWFSDDEWNWCTAVFSEKDATGFWYRRRGADEEVNGWLLLDGEIAPIAHLERSIAHDVDESKPLPRSARYVVVDRARRSLELLGNVKQITPAFFRPPDKRPLLHWNDRSLVRFASSRGEGWGEVEFISTLPAP